MGTRIKKIKIKKKNKMIYFHPEKHTNKAQLENTEKLISEAKKGQIHLILEHHATCEKNPSPWIHSLEKSSTMTLDHVLSIMIWSLDTNCSVLKEMGGVGVMVLCLYTYVCHTLGVAAHVEISDILEKLSASHSPIPPVFDTIFATVRTCIHDLNGGFPGSLSVEAIKDHLAEMVEDRSELDMYPYSIYHCLVVREKIMAESIKAVVGSLQDKKLDVHVVVGANHVAGMVTDEDLTKLTINVFAFRQLENLAKMHYPNERLVCFLKELYPADFLHIRC